MKFVFPFRERFFEINDMPIGGVRIEFAYYIKSLILDVLIENQALCIEVNSNGILNQINTGIKSINSDFEVFYYTGLGLRTFFSQDGNAIIPEELIGQTQDYLIANNYIRKLKFDDIVRVLQNPAY